MGDKRQLVQQRQEQVHDHDTPYNLHESTSSAIRTGEVLARHAIVTAVRTRSPDDLSQNYGLKPPASDKVQVITVLLLRLRLLRLLLLLPLATVTTAATVIGVATSIVASTSVTSAISSAIVSGWRRAGGRIALVRVCGGEVVDFDDEQVLPSVLAGGGICGGRRGDQRWPWIWSSAGSIGLRVYYWRIVHWARRPLAISARAESSFSEADTRSTPTKRPDQMPSAVSAVPGGTWPPTARRQNPSAPSARRIDHRCTSRGAERKGAPRAHTGRPSAPIAGGFMGCGLMFVPQKGRPGSSLGVEDTAPST